MISVTHEEVVEIIIAWVKLAVKDNSFLVIQGFQNGHSPEVPHGVLYMTSDSTTGMLARKAIQVSADDIEIHNHGVCDPEFRLRFIGNGSISNADAVKFFTNTQESRNFLFSKGVSIRTPKGWNFVPKLFDEGSLNTTEITLVLQYSVDYVETVGVIENAELIIKN